MFKISISLFHFHYFQIFHRYPTSPFPASPHLTFTLYVHTTNMVVVGEVDKSDGHVIHPVPNIHKLVGLSDRLHRAPTITTVIVNDPYVNLDSEVHLHNSQE